MCSNSEFKFFSWIVEVNSKFSEISEMLVFRFDFVSSMNLVGSLLINRKKSICSINQFYFWYFCFLYSTRIINWFFHISKNVPRCTWMEWCSRFVDYNKFPRKYHFQNRSAFYFVWSFLFLDKFINNLVITFTLLCSKLLVKDVLYDLADGPTQGCGQSGRGSGANTSSNRASFCSVWYFSLHCY